MTTSSTPAEARAGAILTIDLDAVAANYRLLSERVAPAECAAVLKADAYGLGMVQVAPALSAAGARTFFVAHLEEGITLRALLPEATIGILNGLMPGCAADYAQHRLAPVLNHAGAIAEWTAFCRQQQKRLPAFVHIDTGMNRLGLGPAEVAALIADPSPLGDLELLGYLSHLATADEVDSPLPGVQRDRFRSALDRLPPARASLANSSGIFRGAQFHFDLARPGCALYGINPTPETGNPMARTVRLDARVLQVRHIDSTGTVGYGATHPVSPGTRIATIAVGYADGYLRSLSGAGSVWFGEQEAPVIGRVSMDLITVDITRLPDGAVHPGTLAEVIGPHRTPDQVASEAGTIGYEILTSLGRRYARRHVGGPQ